jgi:kynurenine formamidase
MRRVIPLTLAFVCGCASTSDLSQYSWIDLGYDLSSETVYWPTSSPFTKTTVAEGRTEAGYYYSAYDFCAAEHGGTHIDAPIHFAEGRKTVDQIPLSQLIGPAVKIDVSERALANRDYLISIEDLESWEEQHGRMPEGCIVFLQTGYGRYWPDALKYLGTAKRGEEGVAELHFPGLHPDAATWLVNNRRIKAVGIDTASIDYGQSKNYESHVALMTADIPAIENVANLEALPATGAQVVALPIKIKGGSGGPLRIAALMPSNRS